MDLALAYGNSSLVSSQDDLTEVRFAPNLRRAPVYFEGALLDPLLFRDALLTLHDLVVSDYDTRLLKEDWDRIMDPIVTVAPDQLFFEAFSQDESSYGRVALKPGIIGAYEAWRGGTTNVDFSSQLSAALGGIRASGRAALKVEKDAFTLLTAGDPVREKRVKLPDSWLRGFLNVQAAMCYPERTLQLGRADLRNLLAFLRSHKEREGPRSLVLQLRPGRPAAARFEPWNATVELTQSTYDGDEAIDVRLWGRRRLWLLNRLIPKMKHLTVHLLGSGYPSFWVADLGPATFTLGISGFTVRPFASSALSLAAPRLPVSSADLASVWRTLKIRSSGTPGQLAQESRLAAPAVNSALALLCEQGKVMFDLEAGLFRWREVTDTPMDDLKTEPSHQREHAALELLTAGKVKLTGDQLHGAHRELRATVAGTADTYQVSVNLDETGHIEDGDCDCTWFRHNHLRGGPCKHLLATVAAWRRAGG